VRLRFRPQVEDEIDDAIRWYEERREGLGWQFYAQLLDLFAEIGRNPSRCPWVDETFRRCRLDTFPYSVIFDPAAEPVVVYAVTHQSRDPGYWRSRT